MSKEMEFFIFLIENYAAYKNIGADEVMKKLDELKITDFVYNMYELYHTEAIENAFEDIDKIILNNDKKIDTIKIMFDYGAYPIWCYCKNEIIENNFPKEFENNKELWDIFDELEKRYRDLFINNSVEFSYKGFSNDEERIKFKELYNKGKELLTKLCKDKYIVIDGGEIDKL